MRRREYRNDLALHNMFRMSKALALLPVEHIAEGFNLIKEESSHAENEQIARRYINYFENQWMNRKCLVLQTLENSFSNHFVLLWI